MPDESPVDFGATFRQARERRGLSLQQVAAVTKISARVLEALERNDVSKLPGGIFSRAFIRSYAREVGLDPEVAIERFITEFPVQSGSDDMPSAKDAEDIEAFASGRRAATTIIQLVVLSIAVLVAVFAMNTRACGKAPAAVPAATAPLAPATTSSAASQQAGGDAPAAATPEPAASRIAFTITAQADCWLMVKADSSVVFERLMVAGERFAYQADKSVTLSAGNAGGLAVTLNGKPARPLGTAGQVVTVTITPDTIASFLQ